MNGANSNFLEMGIFEAFQDQQVLIVGDVMIDRYLTGTVSRISPEAPVPVVLHKNTEDRLGGAANVALNVQALGGRPFLCSVVGADADGLRFMERLDAQHLTGEGIMTLPTRRTTVKTRILGNHQQMLRIDREDTHEIDPEEAAQLLARVNSILDSQPIRAVILQDYNKGVLTATLIEAVIKAARQKGVFVAVDPKQTNFFAYKGADLFKPNLKEMRESSPFAIHADEVSLQRAADFLREKLGNRFTMLTLSEKGLFLDGGKGGKIFPTTMRNIADVSGAGDTVISIATMALAAGLEMETVALISNLAGGQVCESPGVVPVNRGLLQQELSQHLS